MSEAAPETEKMDTEKTEKTEKTTEKEEEKDLNNPDTVTKYRLAGDIANKVLAAVIDKVKAGVLVVDLCKLGDDMILEETGKIYKSSKIEKGIAFPTCISSNNVVGHFCPLADDKTTLAEGDVIKIDLGVHVDGYIAATAQTVGLVGPSAAAVGDKKGDLLAAVHNASELALRLVKPGNTNTSVTEMIAKIAEDFGVNAVRGVLSHSMSRFVIDGEKCIIGKANADEKVDEFAFEPNQVYAVDIVMSTGDGKPKEIDTRTTVFKRLPEETYQMKLKASRAVLSEISKKTTSLPFTLRSLATKNASFGIKECVEHGLVREYPVLYEKEGEFVAQIKFTVLLMEKGTIKIAGPSPASFSTEKKITDESLLALLGTSAKKKKKNKKKKKAGAQEGEDAGADE